MGSSNRFAIEPASGEIPKRRRRSIEERRRVVEETFVPGASVARVARAHGVNANQVFHWRRLYQRGRLGGKASTASLLPVKVSDSLSVRPAPESAVEPRPPECASQLVTCSAPSGTIQLQLPKGRLRIEGAADPASLRVVLECLLG
jgi:transposase